MKGYIYIIRNTINNKVYIGKTYLTVDKRFREHKSSSASRKGRPLYKAFDKYGKDNFFIEQLGCYEEGTLEQKEIDLIKEYDSYSNGYNATLGGDGKRYFQYTDKEVIEKYNEVGYVDKTSDFFDCDEHTISKILKSNNIKLKQYKNPQFHTRPILMRDKLGNEREFDTVINAAKWLVDKEITTASVNSARVSIGRAISGLRKSYLGFKWLEK